MPTVRVVRMMESGGRGATAAWRVVSSQPGWVARTAAGLAALVLVIPFLLLLLIALFAGVVVFGVLAGAGAVAARVGRLFGGRPARDLTGAGPDAAGRRNVRVIQREPGAPPTH